MTLKNARFSRWIAMAMDELRKKLYELWGSPEDGKSAAWKAV